MYLAKNTKVLIEGIRQTNMTLAYETSYMKLVQGVEDVYKHIQVVGFKFPSKDTIKLLTVAKKEEGDNVLIPIGSKISFIADGQMQEFLAEYDCTIDMIEEEILEWFEGYREESLCINGINQMFPNIKTGYLIIEGKIGDILEKKEKKTYYDLHNVKDIMKLGVRKGDRLDLKGISSLKIIDVDYGDKMVALSVE